MSVLLRIRDKDGVLRPLIGNRAQCSFSRNATRRNIVLKARQMGITTWVAARFFIATITRPGMLTVQVAHDQRSAEEIFRIVHRFWANLPRRLRMGALRTSRANVRQLCFPLLDSEYRVESAADPDAGRGLTIQNLHASEVARWPRDAARTLASLRAAVPPQGEIVLESTPQGAAGAFYEEWQRAPETEYKRHFYPWWWERSYASGTPIAELTDPEIAMMRERGVTRAQIAYRREMLAQFRKLARQEFAEDAESCFIASGDCVFDAALITARIAYAIEPESQLLRIVPALPGREYVIGVDPAGGGSEGDWAVAQVIDRDTKMQCAELRGHFSPEELARKAVALAAEYNHAWLVVERNNHGHAVLAHLQHAHPEAKVFEKNGLPGWLTTSLTKPQMVARMDALFTAKPELFSSAQLLREMLGFVRHENGRMAAQSGGHDDCVMAMALALAAL